MKKIILKFKGPNAFHSWLYTEPTAITLQIFIQAVGLLGLDPQGIWSILRMNTPLKSYRIQLQYPNLKNENSLFFWERKISILRSWNAKWSLDPHSCSMCPICLVNSQTHLSLLTSHTYNTNICVCVNIS